MNLPTLIVSLAAHAAVLGTLLYWGAGEPPPDAAGLGRPDAVWIDLAGEEEQGIEAPPSPVARRAGAEPRQAPRTASASHTPSATPPARSNATAAAIAPASGVDESAARTHAGARAAAPSASNANANSSQTRGAGPPPWPGPGEVDRVASPRWPIRPGYPARARRRGAESRVVVEAWVDETGEVAFASVIESGGPSFDASAQSAVRRAAFRPARLAGHNVPSRVALRIHFRLYD